MRTFAVLLALAAVVSAETWPTLEQFVRQCKRIVVAKADGQKGKELRFRITKVWKGTPLRKGETYCAYPGEHGVPDKGADEVIFFFGESDRHGTSFPIVNGRLLYAETYDDDFLHPKSRRRWYTVGEFEERVRILRLPMVATADKQFRLQTRGFAKGAAGTPFEFELERDDRVWDGAEIYFDEAAAAVEATLDGKPLADLRAHASVWPWGSPRILVHGLHPGATLDRLALECTVLRIVEAKAYHFDKLTRGKSEELKAPPFVFTVDADAGGATIDCAIEGRNHPHNITPMWALDALSLRDDRFRFLTGQDGAGNHRGFSYSFALARAPRTPLQFPLSLFLRIPTKVEKERLRFEFRDFKLAR